MRQHPTHSDARLLTLLAFVLVALDGSITVCAQTPGDRARMRDLSRREEQVTALERETARKRDPKEILVEVNEDLSRLNVLNQALLANATANNQPPNYEDIVGSVTEIKKRATRLKSSLALPQEENEEKSAGFKDAEKAELQPALAALNKLLDGFLHNPIFSDSGPLDMRLAARARRDLEDIIVLSEKLRKNAEKRSKATDKVP
jgi:hypothetical protein